MRKNFIPMLIFAILLALSPVFVGCGETLQLSSPNALEVKLLDNEFLICWAETEDANCYIVEINGKEYLSNLNVFPATSILSESGKYNIRVKARRYDKKFADSKYSDMLLFSNLKKLDTPILSLSQNILSWAPISGADFYTVVVNGSKVITKDCSFDILAENLLSPYIKEQTTNKFCVYCTKTGNYLQSEPSNIVEKFLASAQDSPKNLKTTKINNRIIAKFDSVKTTKFYTLKIDNTEIITDLIEFDITNNIKGFGIFSISVRCNEVVENGQVAYMPSSFSDVVTFENKPNFVNTTPQNLAVANNVLTFDEIKDALSYKIMIGEEEYESQLNSFDLLDICAKAKHYSIKVKAMNGGYESNFSEIFDYLKSEILIAPTDILVTRLNENFMLSFTPTQNASSYNIYVNEILKKENTNLTNINIAEYLQNGINIISVMSLGDGEIFINSPKSDGYRYVKLGIPKNLAVSVDTKMLSFDMVEGATSYNISIGANVVSCLTNSFDLSPFCTVPNEYKIKVCALLNGDAGEYSSEYIFIVSTVLAAPKGLHVIKEGELIKLMFDRVDNAVCYKVMINGQVVVGEVRDNNVDISNHLTLGSNVISVLSVGDEKIYLNSTQSEPLSYVYEITLSSPQKLDIVAEQGKYYVTFNGVENAESYNVSLKNGAGILLNNFVGSTNKIEIDSYIDKNDTYFVEVVAKSSNIYIKESTANINKPLKLYAQSDYAKTTFFYNGVDYTYVVGSKYALEDLILYCVLYRINNVEVYINYDYFDAKTENPYTSSVSLLDRDIPSLSNLGVDINNLFIAANFSKIDKIMYLIERAHDQMYLYFNANSSLVSQKSNRVYSINFTFNADEEPSITEQKPDRKLANLPIVSSSIKRTPDFNDFWIEKQPSAPVKTTSQLIMVVENGRKPQFSATGTMSELLYNKAKQILREICSDDMTDMQKALAIHDYIVSHNIYDSITSDKATKSPFSADNLKQRAFSAEGMLLDGLSVCEGIAEAFDLLCCMEGLKAVKCFGITGNTDWSKVDFKNMMTLLPLLNVSIGGHSWNRILISGVWYVVDCTWDDKAYGQTELFSHEYFLSDEASISKNRKEFYPRTTFVKSDVDYTASGTYNYYNDTTFTIDGAIYNLTIENEQHLNMVVKNMMTCGQNGFEIKFIDTITHSSIMSLINSAFIASGIDVSLYQIVVSGQMAIVYKI